MRFVKALSIFLVVEALIFSWFGDRILHRLALIWPSSLLSPLQAESIKIVDRLYENNEAGKVVTYVIGASNARHFWEAANTLPPERRRHIVSLTSGSQVLPDALRIIENIDVPGTTVVIGISPHKFANMWFDRTMIETHFMNGVAAKFLLPSQEFDALWSRYRADRDLDRLPWMQAEWQRFDPLIPAAQLIRDMMSENGQSLNDQLQELVRPKETTEQARKANKQLEEKRAVSSRPLGSEKSEDLRARQRSLADEGLKGTVTAPTSCSYRQGPSDHRADISTNKYQQFISWRDFSLRQMPQSVRKSFDMLEFIIDLARKRGIEVVVAETPVPPIEDRELLPYIPAYTDLLHDLAHRRRDIRVITFPRDDTDQRLFADYVHLNKEGREAFKAYLLGAFSHVGDGEPVISSARMEEAGDLLAESWAPPVRLLDEDGDRWVNWHGPDVVTTGTSDFSRPDLLKQAKIPSQSLSDDAELHKLEIGGFEVDYRVFVETVDEAPFELCPIASASGGGGGNFEKTLYDLRSPDGRFAHYVNVTGTVEAGAIGRVRSARGSALEVRPPSAWNQVPIFPPYVGYAFTPKEWKEVAEESDFIPDDSVLGSIPFGPATVNLVDIPAFQGHDHAWLELQRISDARVLGRTTTRAYSNLGATPMVAGSAEQDQRPDAERGLGDEAVVTELSLPGMTSALAGAKIARYGLEIVVDDVKDVIAVDEAFDRLSPTTLPTDEASAGSSNRAFHYVVAPTSPHAIGLVLSDGQFRSFNFGGSDLLSIEWAPESGKALISVTMYDASMRQTFGEDATPYKVKGEQASDGTTALRLKRFRRNLAITDVVPDQRLFMGVSDEPALAFATLHKGGAKASLSIMEHADYQERDNDRLIHYGNLDDRIVEGQGILGNRIPYTKSVFAVGEPFAWELKLNGLKLQLPFLQPTVSTDEVFASYLDRYVATAGIEIAAHSSGTPPDANTPDAASDALTLLRERYGSRIWTDHGGIPTNILYYGWNPKAPRFYIVDRLQESDVNYIWAGPDIYVPTRCVAKGVDDENCTRKELQIDNGGIAPQGLLYDIPMLDPSYGDDWSPSFFRSSFLSGPALKREKQAGSASIRRLPTIEEIDKIVESGRSFVYHLYFGKMLKYHIVDGKKHYMLPDDFNQSLAYLSEVSDRGDLYLTTVTEHMDHVRAMKKLAASSIDGALHAANGGGTSEQTTIMILPYDDEGLLPESRKKIVLDVTPGLMRKKIGDLLNGRKPS